MYACRYSTGSTITESYSDDGEHGAGIKLLKLLRDKNCTDVMVMCTRWFGGVHIGPTRFDYITDCAKSALDDLNDTDSALPPLD